MVEKRVHPSIISIVDVLELFRTVTSLYVKFDCRVSITSFIDLLSDHVRWNFESISIFLQMGVGEAPTRLPTVTPMFYSTPELFETGARKKCCNHLIQESDHGRTGSTAKSNRSIDLTVVKSLKENSSTIVEEPAKDAELKHPSKFPRSNQHLKPSSSANRRKRGRSRPKH